MSILFVLNNITIRNKGLKMKYNQCLDIIEKNIGERPPHAEIARILKCNPTALVNRASRDSLIKDEEIAILEKCYGFSILNNKITNEYLDKNILSSEFIERLSCALKLL